MTSKSSSVLAIVSTVMHLAGCSAFHVVLSSRDGDVETNDGDGCINDGDGEINDGDEDILVSDGDSDDDGIEPVGCDWTVPLPLAFPSARHPRYAQAADLDGDGDLDFVTTALDETFLWIHLNRGDGTFEPSEPIGPFTEIRALELADFDGDGSPDFIVVDDHDIVFKYNDGSGYVARTGGVDLEIEDDGGFYTKFSLAVGEIDGDAHPELVVGIHHMDRVAVVYDPEGDRSNEIDHLSVEFPATLALADLTGDGALDLVVGNASYELPSGPNLAVFMNQEGSLASSEPAYLVQTTVGYTTELGVDDLDADGDIDVTSRSGLGIDVLLNDGTGLLEEASNTAVPFSESVTYDLLDADEDDDLDLVTLTETSGGYPEGHTVDIRLNDGDGFFGEPQPWGIMSLRNSDERLRHLIVGDFDGDSHEDLIVHTSEFFEVLPGPFNDFAYGPPESFSTNYLTTFALCDLDADGDVDILGASESSVISLTVLVNDGAGHLSNGTQLDQRADALVVGDVTGDGNQDAVIHVSDVEGSEIRVLQGNGQGDLSLVSSVETIETSRRVGTIALGDVNGDGALDVVVAGEGGAVHLNEGAGNLAQRSPIVEGDAIYTVSFGDMDGDGDLDIVGTRLVDEATEVPTYQPSIYENNGTGQFEGPTFTANRGQGVSIADVDDDGDLDIVTYYGPDELMGTPYPDEVSVWLNDGAGDLAGPALSITIPVRPARVSVVDVDHDSDPDVLLWSWSHLGVMFNRDGTFDEPIYYFFNSTQPDLTGLAADMTGDGAVDVVLVGRGGIFTPILSACPE